MTTATHYTDLLTTLIKQAFTDLGLPQPEHIELDTHPQQGDVSTNIAMKHFKTLENAEFANPRALATAVAEKVQSLGQASKPAIIANVEVAGPGFINIHLTEQFLKAEIGRYALNGTDMVPNLSHGQKVVVEYTDPNPFKELHIGHLYSNIVGESIATMLENTGADVWRADFFGDVGMHVAKSIWGLLKNFADDDISIDDLGSRTLSDRVKYLGQAYSRGATAYEEDEQAKEEMKILNFLGFKAAQEVVLPQYQKQPEINYDQYIKPSAFNYQEIKHIYELGRAWSLEYFETIYKKLGTKFKGYYPESLTGEYGYGLVLDGLKQGVFEKGENGALIFPGEKHGLHNRVFINALGLPTYETKDLGNAIAKFQDVEYDKSVIVTANEINEYFVVVLKALRMMKPELGEKTVHIGHGLVKLPEGKMSSRTGKIISGEWLLDEAENQVREILKTTRPDMEPSQVAYISEKVSLAAIKYAFLKNSIGGNISFSFDESLSFQGNSGPYLQYTYVRCFSILEKAKANQNSSIAKYIDELLYSLMQSEKALAKALIRFPEVVELAATEYSPHHVCTYLYDLAQTFNSFYTECPVLADGVEEEARTARLALTQATANVLQKGLQLLGIETVEKM